MNYTEDGKGWTSITRKAVKDQMQYWYSRWCNYIINDKVKESYHDLYEAYKKLDDAYTAADLFYEKNIE